MTQHDLDPNDDSAHDSDRAPATAGARRDDAPRREDGPSEDDGGAGQASAAPEAIVSELQRERDDYYDRLLRKTAEFDNYRKRIERERRELQEWAAADVLMELLAVLDDFERALTAPAPPEAETYRTGVELIHRQLADILRKRGATPIDAVGGDFDPHLHEAVAYEETPGAREGEIVAELRKGYKLGDRLLRPASVKVAKAS